MLERDTKLLGRDIDLIVVVGILDEEFDFLLACPSERYQSLS